MTTPRALRHVARQQLVARVREGLMRRSAPRLQLLTIIVVSGGVAFATSVFCLRLGVTAMALRYPLAVIGGYLAFLVLIRTWIAWQRRVSEPDDLLDPGDAVELAVELSDHVSDIRLPSLPDHMPAFAAGRSGGAGGGSNWGGSLGDAIELPDGVADADEFWPVVVAVLCALGGLIAVGYVIYAAPLLLAEVALDAAVVSALYRRLRKQDLSHWAMTVLRKTWIPALVLMVFAAAGGAVLQRMAPEAHSIGGVVRAWRQ